MATATENAPCLDCGMCCDGTLYSFVHLKGSERLKADKLGTTRKEIDGKPVFLEPCPALSGTACTIYADRFHTCRTYRCATLKALDEGGIDHGEAMRRIHVARTAEAQVRTLLAPGETLQSAREAWANEPDTQRATPEGARIHLMMTALEMLLSRYFRQSGEQRLPFADRPE